MSNEKQPALTLITDPDPRLRDKCWPVATINSQDVDFAHFMASQLEPLEAAGLAAPQFGVMARIIVVRIDTRVNLAIFNPEIVRARGEHFVYDSCRSLPGRRYYLKRPRIVKVRGLRVDSSPVTVKGSDFLAQVLVHEIQHLDGIMIDTLGKLV